MPSVYRFTKAEKSQLALAARIQNSPAATSSELLQALKIRQRVIEAAQRRQGLKAADEPVEPSIDSLVAELEKRAIPAKLKPAENAVSAEIAIPPTQTPSGEIEPLKTPLIERAGNQPLIRLRDGQKRA